MDWRVVAALTVLAVALVVGLVLVVYTSVSKYAKQMAPGDGPTRADAPHDRRPTV